MSALTRLGIADTETWMTDAACVGADPELFFLPSGKSAGLARQTCAACPVQRDCLEYALRIEGQVDYRSGVWGGLIPDERRDLARKRSEKRANRRGGAR